MAKLGLTLDEIVALLAAAGEVKIHGDGAFRCTEILPLGLAGKGDLGFLRDPGRAQEAIQSRAGALLVGEHLADCKAHQIVVAEPMAAFVLLLRFVADEKRKQDCGVDPRALVEEGVELGAEVTVGAGVVVRRGAVLGERVVIYPNAYIGARSHVGDDSVIHPNVTIMEDVTIGKRVVVHGGTVIGCDGYGFLPHEGRQVKIPQVGEVVIGDDVEIGACSTIDRATIGRTVIGRGTKIGDLVHVAHNCEIGEDVLLLPTVAISGSVKVGDRAIFAGRAGCAGHITIGEGAQVGATSVAYKDVPAGAQVWGNPANEKITEMRIQSALRKLPEMQKELRALKKKVQT